MDIVEQHHANLIPLEEENYDIALKNYVLFSTIEEKKVICLLEKYMSISFDFLSKFHYSYEVVFLDEVSYDRLYHRFIEIKTDKDMINIQKEQELSLIHI